jgi:hypothetical protein
MARRRFGQRLISGFRNPVTATPPWSQRATLAWPEFEVPWRRVSNRMPRLFKNVGPFWKPEASGKPCGVYED